MHQDISYTMKYYKLKNWRIQKSILGLDHQILCFLDDASL